MNMKLIKCLPLSIFQHCIEQYSNLIKTTPPLGSQSALPSNPKSSRVNSTGLTYVFTFTVFHTGIQNYFEVSKSLSVMSREKSIEGIEIIDLDDCFKHQFQGSNRRMKDI